MSENTRGGRTAQRKDVMLTIPIEARHDPLTKIAAQRDGRPVAGWIRHLILSELQRQGLVDESFNPVEGNEPATVIQ
jgi:hypothetical protein